MPFNSDSGFDRAYRAASTTHLDTQADARPGSPG